ncbi:hypothetical protein EYF80_015927 [Liparis tanakae]|uniref:Uncharacterized protein n=1 Tax=Liparis tanakae TaxID=230148 RepID=A0A4Z2I7U2_9TELE|nr:hypothetical protein EYF80_015927 [Liparis tanakae]
MLAEKLEIILSSSNTMRAWLRSSVFWASSSSWTWGSGSDVSGSSRSKTRATNSATWGEEVGWVWGRATSIMKI